MSISYSSQPQPNPSELQKFFETVFAEITDSEAFSSEQSQSLAEWFSIEQMIAYLPYGQLIEARAEGDQLVGALFIGQQNPMTWPDGRKMELFILGVHPQFQHQGIAQQLMSLAEKYASEHGCKKTVVNTHRAMESVHAFYEKLGYTRIGVLSNYYDNGDAVFFQKNM